MGSRQNIFPQISWGPLTSLGFLLCTSLKAVTLKAEEKGVFEFLVLEVAAQPKVAGPTARTAAMRVNPPEGPQGGLHPSVVALRLRSQPAPLPKAGHDPPVKHNASQHSPTSSSLTSSLALTQLWFLSLFPTRNWDQEAKWRFLLWVVATQKKTAKSHIVLCPSLSHLVLHQVGPLSWGKPWHWLSPRREDTCKAWNLHVEGFSLGSHLPEAVQGGSPCGYLPVEQLASWRSVGICLQQAWFTAHKIRLGFGSDPVRGLYCSSVHRNTKEQSLVICSIISSSVP